MYTAINPETAPPGSLQQALGVVIKRPGIIQKERPFRQYSSGGDSAFSGGGGGYALWAVGGTLYIQDGQTGRLQAEATIGAAIYANLTLPFLATNADTNDLAVRSTEALGNWYAPFATGLLKIDTAGNTGYAAGCPKGLDPQLTLVGAGTMLTNGQSVAYRVVWKRIDANNNLVLGAPSGRVTITATGNDNVTVKAFLPPQIVADATPTAYYIQVYRTLTFATGVSPDDECGLVYDAKLTATDSANGYASFTDASPDFARGASLYTNPSQQGIGQANDPPPVAQDAAYFKGSHFLAATTQKQRATLVMLGPPEQWAIQSIAANTPGAGQSTYTFLAAVDLTGIDNTMKLAVVNSTGASNDGTWAIVSINNGTHTVVVTNAGVAQAGVAGTAMSGRLRIAQTHNLDLYPIYAAESAASKYYQVPSGTSTSANLFSAAYSLCRIINQQASADIVAYVTSGPDDLAPILLIEEASLGGAAFTAVANGTTTVGYQGAYSNKWAPAIPATASISSVNDARKNRLCISKSGQPEAFPVASFLDVGSQSTAILRIIGLREALLVFKQDGLFRVTGSNGNFSWAPYDLTQVLIGKGFATAIQNQAAALTRKGLFLFSETGFRYLSAPVADVISRYTALRLDSLNGTGWRSNVPATYGSGLSASDNDGVLYLYLNDSYSYAAGSSLNAVSLSYSLASGAWSQSYCDILANRTNTDGITGQANFPALNFIQRAGGRIGVEPYGGAVPDVYVEDQWSEEIGGQWGQAGTNLGFGELAQATMTAAAEPLPGHKYLVNITAVNGGASQITATALAGPALAVGSILRPKQGGSLWKVTVANGAVLTLTRITGTLPFSQFQTGAGHRAYNYVSQPSLVEYQPYAASDEATLAQWSEASVILDPLSTVTAASVTIGFFTESSPAASIVMQAAQPDQGSTLQRVGVPQNCQVARRLSLRVQHSNPLEYFFIKGVSYEYEKAEADRATN